MVSTIQRINKYGMSINETDPDDKPVVLKLRGFPGKSKEPTKAEKWVNSIYEKLPKNPLDNRQVAMVFGEGENQQIALFEIKPSMTDPNAAYIEWFQAYPQKQGVGTKAMSRLQDLARSAGIRLMLTSWKHGKVPERVLNRFYKSMGFKPGKSREGMVWDPDINEATVSDKKIAELLRNVADSFKAEEPYDAVEWVEESDITIDQNAAIKALFDANMHQLGYLVLQEMTHGDSSGDIIRHLRRMFEDIGIDIPDDKIANYLYDKSMVISKALRRLVSQGMIDDAINTMIELNNWGLNIMLEDFIDLEEEKDTIIKSMLKMMKIKGSHDTVAEIIEALEECDIDWPELDAFRKSLGQLSEASWSKYDPESYDDSEDPSYIHNKRHATGAPASVWNKMNPTDTVDDGIREPSVTKVIPEIGKFVFSGHFRDRMRQRKVEPIDAFNLVAYTFRKHHKLIQDMTDQTFICIDPSGLGIVIAKVTNRNGPEYTLLTVHPRLAIDNKRRSMTILREDGVLDKTTPSVDDLAMKYNVPVQDILIELKKGVKVELEHTTQLHIAREIALDHLGEDLYYYVKLAKIEAGDKSSVGLDENSDEHDRYLEELMIHLKSYLLDRQYDQSMELIQEICYMDDVPDRLKELLDRNKNGLLRRLLEFIKYSTMGNYLTPSLAGFDAKTVVSGLRKLGVDWPELDAIGKSVKRR